MLSVMNEADDFESFGDQFLHDRFNNAGAGISDQSDFV
jgi:hypothetical protein